MCPIGSEGCSCTAGGGCDPGLVCDAGICVSESYAGDEEAEYMFAEDLAAPAPTVMEVRSRGRERRQKRSAKRPAPGPALAPAEAVGGGGDAVDVAVPEGAPRDPADEIDHSRQVVYTAALHVSVYELDAAAELAESLPGKYGGWIESRYDYQITLRIRAEHLFDAIAELSALGVVLDRQLHAEDVTAEYVDLEARIRILEELVAQLEALLARAKCVELALEIRVALDRARLELEVARARMRALVEMIDFSTLTLFLSQRGPAEQFPSTTDPFPWVDELGVELTAYR